MEGRIKVLVAMILLGSAMACAVPTPESTGEDMYFSPPNVGYYKWNDIADWAVTRNIGTAADPNYQWVYLQEVPDYTDSVFLSWTDPLFYPESGISTPAVIETWQDQGYESDPGIVADAVCRQVWVAGHHWFEDVYEQRYAGNMIVEGDLVMETNFVMGGYSNSPTHNTVLIADTATVSAAGSLYCTNPNVSSDYIITQQGGTADLGGGIVVWGGLIDWTLNGNAHLSFGGGLGSLGGATISGNNLVIDVNSIDADLVVQTAAFDSLVTAGSIQAEGVTVTSGTVNTLMDVMDIGDGFSEIALRSTDKASHPAPAKTSENVDINTGLSWRGPSDANELTSTYTVYFDTDTNVDDGTSIIVGPLLALGRGAVSNAQIGGPLSVGTTYYWRVDTVFGGTTYTGDLWSFTAGATLPELVAPSSNFLDEVNIDVALEWTSDPIVNASKVILTPVTAFPEVGTPVDLGEQVSGFKPYDVAPASMNWDTTYTWQVIELDAADNPIAVGPLWRFRVRSPECVGLTADLTGDCLVNLADFAMLAGEWLSCNWEEGVPSRPCP